MSDYRLKTLKVDDREFWQQEQYPLCLEEKLQVELSGKESILANYHLFEGSYYNYNPEDINSIFIGGEIIPARAVDRTWLNLSNNYTLYLTG
jgi:hypothetical protein